MSDDTIDIKLPRPHYIKTNKICSHPTHMIFYDTETSESAENNVKVHRLKLGVARYILFSRNKIKTDVFYVFKTPNEFWDIIEKHLHRKTTLYIFSHNQHFDFNIIGGFEQLNKRGFSITKLVIESDNFIVKARKNEATIVFLDTQNYVKTSLNEIGKSINLEKLKVDFATASEQELLNYCKRDVEILSEFMLKLLKWWRANNLGKFGLTASQLAFNAFRHRFMKHKILVHNNPPVIELELRSYRGGRTECFRLGEIHQTVYELDINSMYPYVMKNFYYPIKLLKYIENPTIDEFKHYVYNYATIADVDIETSEPTYGIKHNNKLVFPIGKLRTVLTTPELLHAINRDEVIRVHRLAVYSRAYIFRDYVDYFYKLKKEAEDNNDAAQRVFAKLLLNSLYGKFAQRTRELVKIIDDAPIDYGAGMLVDVNTLERKTVYYIAGKTYLLEKTPRLFYDANIAIASHVTAYARMYLWKLIKVAQLENVFYVDTDSLFVNEEGYKNLDKYIGDELGKLKLKKKASNMIIYGPKDYIIDTEIKTKGVPKKAQKISDTVYIYERFLKTKTLLRKGILNAVILQPQTKKLKRNYDKGIVHPDGKITPLILNHF